MIKSASLSGADIRHRCMPNRFGHILFGRLKSLPDDVHYYYRGDRIYIKPEEHGLQQYRHYIARESIVLVRLCSSNYISLI